MSYDAVVFDYDGVLMEPTPLDVLYDAARTSFHQHDADPLEDHVQDLAIGVDHDWFHDICDHYGLDPHAFWRTRDTNASDHQIDLVERGEKALYDDLHAITDLALPRGIVSTNQQRTIDHHLAYHDLDSHFHAVYGREPHPDSLWKKKPNPHYLERALADLEADTALFVGDSTTDIEAAHNAGVDSVYIRRDHNGPPEVDPTFEVDTLHALSDIVSAPAAADD